jgi:hypothetical protein
VRFSTPATLAECGVPQVIPVAEAIRLAEDTDDKAVWIYLVQFQLGQA